MTIINNFVDESETRDKDDEDEEDEIGGLFKVLKEKSEASSRAAVNSKDCSKCLINNLVKLELEQVILELALK